MAAKTSAKSAAVAAPVIPAPVVAPAVEPVPDSPLAVELDAAAPSAPTVRQPILKLITFDQILVDGKLGGKPAALLAKRPELAPHVVELFRAREAKLLDQHAAELAAKV